VRFNLSVEAPEELLEQVELRQMVPRVLLEILELKVLQEIQGRMELVVLVERLEQQVIPAHKVRLALPAIMAPVVLVEQPERQVTQAHKVPLVLLAIMVPAELVVQQVRQVILALKALQVIRVIQAPVLQ
jgi:hypothetical protein